jgi:phosphoenolpyruvate synthase/pyruvate phosphate dikinase
LHDLRKEVQMKSTYALNLILLEVCRRTGQKYSEVVWSWPEEVEALIKTSHFDSEKVNARKESYFTIVYLDSIEECTGEKAIARRKQEFSQKMENLRDFRGVPASMGRVSGKVRVCFSANDAIAKVQKGDVLVASMTLPDYVPAMKKAAAIITDEGGVTCHAAIVSRELKIPCIVGTKIATKVLKDGDMVDVNANHALVTILSSKNA